MAIHQTADRSRREMLAVAVRADAVSLQLGRALSMRISNLDLIPEDLFAGVDVASRNLAEATYQLLTNLVSHEYADLVTEAAAIARGDRTLAELQEQYPDLLSSEPAPPRVKRSHTTTNGSHLRPVTDDEAATTDPDGRKPRGGSVA